MKITYIILILYIHYLQCQDHPLLYQSQVNLLAIPTEPETKRFIKNFEGSKKSRCYLDLHTTPNDHTSHLALQSPLIASGGLYAGVPFATRVHVDSISSPDTASLRRPKSATLNIKMKYRNEISM